MLGNCEKMLLISPTANEWPQNHHHHQIIDEKGMNIMSSSTANNNRAMEKLAPPSQDQQQHGLKCPRCDSSNTKFCYYNNYSLSQPRHFCKACKRYWTRGGTLRNVPVGGGCRKNKRVKRPSSSSSSAIDAPSSATTTNTSNPISGQPQIDISSTHMSPLFYGLLPNNPSDPNLPFSRVSAGGYDLHHQSAQLSDLGLGFSSSGIDDYRNGFNLSSTSNSPLVSNYNNNSSMFGPNSSSFSTTSNPTMASLLAFSSLHHQYKLTPKETLFSTNHLHTLMPFEDMQIGGNNGDQAEPAPAKEVKVEGGQNRLDNWSAHSQNQMEQIGSSDPSSLYWNTTNNNVGANWPDLPNIGSSVTSLI